MAKLKLSLEQLAVESFASEEPAAGKRGTVRGQQESGPETCGEFICYPGTEEPQDTCYIGCTMLCSMGTCTQIYTNALDPQAPC